MHLPRLRLTQPSGAPAPENRRRAGRIRTLGVQCTLGEVVDISASGMRVISRGRAVLGEGQGGTISMATPAGVLALDVRVMWVRRSGWRSAEMGVQLINVTPDVLEGVRSILRGASIGPVETEEMLKRKVA
jgi:hypothetical protein